LAIFTKSLIKNKKQDEKLLAKRWLEYQKYKEKSEYIKTLKEEKYQEGFFKDLFEACLGYTLDTTDHTAYNLEREKKNETDAKKADGVISIDKKVVGVVELKAQDSKNLDKAVDQAFGYLVSHSDARYVVVSNFDELRFYIDKKTEYEKFHLFSLDYESFKKLHLILSFESIKEGVPLLLKEKTASFESDISKELYKDFSTFRTHLFENIVKNNTHIDPSKLLRLTQKLCDRIIFILFAEDRGLLGANTISEIRKRHELDVFGNSLYEYYKIYFHAVNEGNEKLNIPKYNGGLFAKDEELDSLKVDDSVLDMEAQKLSDYDFDSEVSVNILGHIFEQSLTDLEEIQASIEQKDFDKKMGKRKKDGVFYTPEYITRYIVQNTLGKLCQDKQKELGIEEITPPKNAKKPTKKEQKQKQNLEQYRKWLLELKILDPACGSGAFLNQALEYLIAQHSSLLEKFVTMGDITATYEIEKNILENNLYGVDINEDATEIAKLSLWLRTAHRGRELTKLADKIKCGNSLIDDKSVSADAFVWEEEFPEVFENGGFDVVIGNPPYVDSESMTKHYENERNWISKKYKTAKGNWDLFIPFIELALKILKNHRAMSFIIPNKILSAKYAKTARSFVNTNYSLNEIYDISKVNVFGVDVYPVILFLQKNKQISQLKISKQTNEKLEQKSIDYVYENNWALYSDDNYGFYAKIANRFDSLKNNKNFKLFSSASVSEAYEIKEVIYNNHNKNQKCLKLINTGTIDPYIDYWGIAPMQYIKDSYLYPVVNLEDIKQKEWTQSPKLSFAGMALRIEASIDLEGQVLPLKSTTVLTAKSTTYLAWICSLLNSKLLTNLFKIANSANTMAGGYLNINQDNLGLLPIPNYLVEEDDTLSKYCHEIVLLYKMLQQTKQNFINELELEKIPKKLQNFESLEFEEFVKEYKKAKKLKFADKLQERNFKNDWKALFENDKKEVLELQGKVNQIDEEIDEMVYKLYDLTDEEIKIVEGV
jgi:hypothetical protein